MIDPKGTTNVITHRTARRIVVGVDGSDQSKHALRWAARLAVAEDARLDAVAAWDFPSTFQWTSRALGFSPKLDIEKSLTEAVDDVFGTDRPAGMRLITHEGNAAQVLLMYSQGAVMVVTGSRGHGGFAGMVMGSVSAKVAEYALCPALIVHGGAPTPCS